MSEPKTTAEEIFEGTKAKTLMESPVFQNAVARVQQSYFDRFAEVDPADKDALQVVRLQLRSLADVVRDLKSVIETGTLAEIQTAEREKRDKAKKEKKPRQSRRGVF